MKIVLLTTGLQLGGAETQVADLARGFLSRGHEVMLVSVTGACSIALPMSPRLTLVELKASKTPWSLAGAMRQFASRLRAWRPDVVHAHMVHANLLARLTRGHVHLAHMSTKGSVELIRWGKERGINVTAEVCPHHLSLTEEAVEGYDTNAKMNPPLRTAEDVAALRDAVRDGTIDLVATDHAPHHYDEKEREFQNAPNGIVGLETALSVVVDSLVVPGHIDYSTLVERMSCSPARLFGLPGGSLRTGTPADVTIFDPARRWTVDPEQFLSKGRNTPYAGMTLTGRTIHTVVGGEIVYTLKEQKGKEEK